MSPRARRPPADAPAREAARRERARNVVIDAGAGTGKTTLLVERLVGMVAPEDDAAAAVDIGRIAAITFTRRAAGELRLRIRERILALLAGEPTPERRDRLLRALAGPDTAAVGPIHSFADRLLRLRPVESGISPDYEIVEDAADLHREVFERLMEGCQSDSLPAMLAGSAAAERASEAAATVLDALRAGLLAESVEHEHGTLCGLDALVSELLTQRDIDPQLPDPGVPDLAAFRDAARTFIAQVKPLTGDTRGVRWLQRMAAIVRRQLTETDPCEVFREIAIPLQREFTDPTKGRAFDNDKASWDVWKNLTNCDAPLRDAMTNPIAAWLARRLVALRPVVLELYARLKAERRAVDQVDLLLELRDLLRRDKAVRADHQKLFDHIFVDEFQDTDPLQAEIVFFLCEDGAVADEWGAVQLRPGTLTVVGDPKQSIYRFRRADVAAYAAARGRITAQAHLTAKLTVNFRSAAPLIDWFNDRFTRILGQPPAEGMLFNAATGAVYQEPLDRHRPGFRARHVHLLPLHATSGNTVGCYRPLEGAALARYLRWPVERVLLGLRALADRDDGVAEAVLLRPPFFALDLIDHAHARPGGAAGDAAARERVEAAPALVRELRRRRAERPPGATARDLLEQTACGRTVAAEPNGAMRLTRLRELCFALERLAMVEGWDYDAATAHMREWVDNPVKLEAPRPVGVAAVEVLTVHQAKGLEFPVVVLWDAVAAMAAKGGGAAWRVARAGAGQGGAGWALGLRHLAWDEPEGSGLKETEKDYANAERRRVLYVAHTRARDLLVAAKPLTASRPGGQVWFHVLEDTPAALVEELAEYMEGGGATWSRGIEPRRRPAPVDGSALEREIADQWRAGVAESGRPRFRPVAVSVRAAELAGHAQREAERGERRGRYGPDFGTTVHIAIGIALRDPMVDAAAAVARAIATTALAHHVGDAIEDVRRTLAALEQEGLRRAPGPDLRLEYPVAYPDGDGNLVVGQIDLVSVTPETLTILDFKTDAPPAPERTIEQAVPAYVEQLRLYAGLLQQVGIRNEHDVRCGLLFAAEGVVRWVTLAH